MGTSADVSLKIAETDLSSLTASIRAPSGNEEPCLLKKLPNRHLGKRRLAPCPAEAPRLFTALARFAQLFFFRRYLFHPQGGGRARSEREEERRPRGQQPV